MYHAVPRYVMLQFAETVPFRVQRFMLAYFFCVSKIFLIPREETDQRMVGWLDWGGGVEGEQWTCSGRKKGVT